MLHIDLRRAIIALEAIGQSTVIPGKLEALQKDILSFARAKRITVRLEPDDAGIKATRIEFIEYGGGTYPQIAELAPGGSVLLQAHPGTHQRVRVAASQMGMKTGRMFRCSREGDAIRVTRLDGVGPADAVLQPRPTKYNLERLTDPGARLTFEIPTTDQHKLRLACSNKAKAMGWSIRCRLQDDGTMLVYRTDAPVIAP